MARGSCAMIAVRGAHALRYVHRNISLATRTQGDCHGAGAGRNLTCALLLAAGLFGATAALAADPIVFAAASTKDAVGEIADDFAAAGKGKVVASYASSGDLAKQIENGAPAAIFISADTKWVDYLDGKKKLLVAGSRRDLLGNHLVLVAPLDSTMTIDLKPGAPLAAALGGRQARRRRSAERARRPLCQGRPYQARHLGPGVGVEGGWAPRTSGRPSPWSSSARRRPASSTAPTPPSRRRSRSSPSSPRTFPPKIVYPVALVAGQDTPEAKAFFDYLNGPEAAAVFGNTASSCCSKPCVRGPRARGKPSPARRLHRDNAGLSAAACGRPMKELESFRRRIDASTTGSWPCWASATPSFARSPPINPRAAFPPSIPERVRRGAGALRRRSAGPWARSGVHPPALRSADRRGMPAGRAVHGRGRGPALTAAWLEIAPGVRPFRLLSPTGHPPELRMRLPLIPPDELSAEQRPFYEDMRAEIARNFQGFRTSRRERRADRALQPLAARTGNSASGSGS